MNGQPEKDLVRSALLWEAQMITLKPSVLALFQRNCPDAAHGAPLQRHVGEFAIAFASCCAPLTQNKERRNSVPHVLIGN